MKKKIILIANPDFDKKFLNGISRLYQIFCRVYNYYLEIVDESYLETNCPSQYSNIIVIAGGDGTIHRILNTIPEKFLKEYIFGIIPTGTANEFAKAVDLPLLLEQAAYLIANHKINNIFEHKIAVVNNEKKFLTGMLYGVACQALQSTSQESKIFWGNFAYNLPGLLALSSFSGSIKEFKTEFEDFSTGYLIINNASLISKDLSIKDLKDENNDLFAFIYIKSQLTTQDIIRLLVKNHARLNILADSSVVYKQQKEINLEFEGESLFMLDGEIYQFASPLNIKHFDKNIKIICPTI